MCWVSEGKAGFTSMKRDICFNLAHKNGALYRANPGLVGLWVATQMTNMSSIFKCF